MVGELMREEGGYAVRKRLDPKIIDQSTIKLLSDGHRRGFICPSMTRALKTEIRDARREKMIFHLYHICGQMINSSRGVLFMVSNLIEITSYYPVSVFQEEGALDLMEIVP